MRKDWSGDGAEKRDRVQPEEAAGAHGKTEAEPWGGASRDEGQQMCSVQARRGEAVSAGRGGVVAGPRCPLASGFHDEICVVGGTCYRGRTL